MKKLYGLLGQKLGQSWSVPIHQKLGCPDYRLIERDPAALSAFLQRKDIGGLNVTIPYKRDVMPFCDWIDKDAKAIGSVNTLVRKDNGVLCGWNTDAGGFRAMAKRAGVSFQGRKVVILGSGGASLTVQAVVRQEGAREVVVVSRSGPDNYDTLSRHADAEILINATPVGMYPETGATLVNLTAFPALQGVLDLIYNPLRTVLLLQAEKLGIPCSNGLPMLVCQAAEAEEHFRNTRIPPEQAENILAELWQEKTNIVLIGMPGSGKSAAGQALASLTGREVIDIDEEIVKSAGQSIPEIFASGGEAAFRERERAATAEAGRRNGVILVTGGGVVKDARNYTSLRQNGRIYHLLRNLDLLPTEGRPLSQGADLADMWAQRGPLYERFRDVAIDNNGFLSDTAGAIWRDFCAHSGSERP